MECPNCRQWMPCIALTRLWRGENEALILSYQCDKCGRNYDDDGPDGLRPIGEIKARMEH